MQELLLIDTEGYKVVIAITIFLCVFLLVAIDKIPNAILAVLGAFLLYICNVLPGDVALAFIDFDTLGLLCGMMIIVAVIRRTGFFEYVAIKGIKLAKGNSWRIFLILSFVTALLSALLDNVTTVLIIVPLTYALSDAMRISPIPFVISEILFSNIGGTATLIGDPPNIMIGVAANLSFMDFITNLLPVVLVISIVIITLLRVIYHKHLKQEVVITHIEAFDEKRSITDKTLFIKTMVVFTLVIAGFVTHHIHGKSIASIALGGAFILLLITKQTPDDILKEVEWPTLFFFMGLFIVVGGLKFTGVIGYIGEHILTITGGDIGSTTQFVLWVSAVSTSLVNSIPYTATFISIIQGLELANGGDVESVWWALSLGACLGGNGTIIASAANIIVASFSKKTQHPLSFKAYVKVGLPLMLVTIAIASGYLWLFY